MLFLGEVRSTTMAGLRAVPYEWRGIKFASTLEADWALNLEKKHIAWDYEPEAVKLPDGQNYRCDFYLRRIFTWLEVKGPHDQRIDKIAGLAQATLHAPGCDTGRPSEQFRIDVNDRPDCLCGYGPRFPWRLVVIGRPNDRGLMAFEGPHWDDRSLQSDMRLVLCPHCQCYSFVDIGLPGARPICRRCRTEQPTATAWKSGGKGLTFARHAARGKSGRGRNC